jgi:hypothetical protein
MSQNINRAMIRCRTSSQRLSRTVIDGGIIVEDQNPVNDERFNLKLDFLLKLFVFQNWDVANIGHITIDIVTGDRVEFGRDLNDMKRCLINLNSLGPQDLIDPVIIEEVVVEERINNEKISVRNRYQAVLNVNFPLITMNILDVFLKYKML